MKVWFRTLMVAMLLLSVVGVASADFSGPYYDTYVIVNGSVNPTAPNLAIQDSTGACNDAYISYIQFDASNILAVSSASLKFTVGGTPGGLNNSPTLTLYGVTDFNPATLNGTNYPRTATGELIQNMVIPSTTAANAQFTFGGSDTGLANYIQAQANGATPQTVTLALSFSANCFNQTSISFYSQEGGTQAQDPTLTIVGTRKDPTAVAMTDFSAASDSKATWPLYAGLGALALIVVGGVAVSRRRTAAR